MKAFPHAISCLILFSFLTISSCSTTEQSVEPTPDLQTVADRLERPLPYPVEVPPSYLYAVDRGTRTANGAPADGYWQNYAYYTLHAEIDTSNHTLHGNSQVTYENNSPQPLHVIVVELAQNLHKAGVPKNESVEITGGMDLARISINGEEIGETSMIERWTQNASGYILEGTHLYIYPQSPLRSGQTMNFGFEWSFEIPERGAAGEDSGRMGRSRDNLYFLAYWYPQIAVYDDVYGWFNDPFLGKSEFYHEFADYDVTITAPDEWLVMATGEFLNPENTLSDEVLERYRQAGESDDVVTIVDFDELGNVTQNTDDGKLTWRFQSQNVIDVAFSATLESKWDGARAPVGDLDGDGETDYTRINTFYREPAPLWEEQVGYSQHSIDFLSEYTDIPYPWPHMTSVEGADIIGGGMEFPMMTVIGDYNQAGAVRLHSVTAHELAHMWFPMMISTNERRYTWMDEGFTSFHDNLASVDKYGSDRFDQMDVFSTYMQIAGTELEGEMMRWSDFHYYSNTFSIASYDKPASVLYALKGLVGDDLFLKAHREFMKRWKYKHPYPWDFFRTVEDVTGMDLSWFWRSWYYETWVLDQGVGDVNRDGDAIVVEIEDHGNVPMPATVYIEFEDDTAHTETISVERWLNGYRSIELRVVSDADVLRVTVDPEYEFPDIDRSNNQWAAEDDL
ncbi:MAG: M1 family metallopeptidase [Balneolaceae bacterium]|nr:M1 family metallopeptidase [Balneolaceae bacterium]